MALSSKQEDAVECWGRRMTGSPTLQQHCDAEEMVVCDSALQGKLQWLTAAGQQSRPDITPRTVSLAQLIPSVRTRYRSALAGQLLGLHSHSVGHLVNTKPQSQRETHQTSHDSKSNWQQRLYTQHTLVSHPPSPATDSHKLSQGLYHVCRPR